MRDTYIISSIAAAVIRNAVCCLTTLQACMSQTETAPETEVCWKKAWPSWSSSSLCFQVNQQQQQLAIYRPVGRLLTLFECWKKRSVSKTFVRCNGVVSSKINCFNPQEFAITVWPVAMPGAWSFSPCLCEYPAQTQIKGFMPIWDRQQLKRITNTPTKSLPTWKRNYGTFLKFFSWDIGSQKNYTRRDF